MKFSALFILALSTSAFAVSDCITFPVDLVEGPKAIKGTISSESIHSSYGGCPDSVLLNERFIARLSQLKEINFEKRCIYSSNSIAFACKQ